MKSASLKAASMGPPSEDDGKDADNLRAAAATLLALQWGRRPRTTESKK